MTESNLFAVIRDINIFVQFSLANIIPNAGLKILFVAPPATYANKGWVSR